jgi:hypothetical protein
MAKPPPPIGTIEDGHEYVGGDPGDTKNWVFWGPSARRMANGAIVQDRPGGGVNVLKPAAPAGTPNLKEQQSLAASRANLMLQGEKTYQAALRQGYEPASIRNKAATVADAVPVIGDWLAELVRDPVSERGAAGERQFTEGALRTVTGAGGPANERPLTTSQFFPTSFQSVNPDLRERLAATRRAQLATALRVAGPAIATAKNTAPVRIKGDADYDALPPGTRYIGPDGKTREKR